MTLRIQESKGWKFDRYGSGTTSIAFTSG